MQKEKCIICGVDTEVDVTTHVDFRVGYIEGAGQLCTECYLKGNSSSREQITFPKEWVKRYSNNYELGEKVRQHYWREYEDMEPPIENQWVCKICGKDTSEIEYDYLVGTNHLECVLKKETNKH
jgi:hypothetical protein